jgi:hypothetical protein
MEPHSPGVEPILGCIDHPDSEPMVENSGLGENFGFADWMADARANSCGEVCRQSIKSPVGLDEKVQSAQLLEHPTRPPCAGELGRNGSEHTCHSWCLRINHACGHSVEVGITCLFQAGDATAYLVAQPLVKLIKASGYPFGTCRGSLGCGRGIG